MKKALSLFSFVAGSIMVVSAQTITVGSGAVGTVAGQGQVNGGALLGLLAVAQTFVTRLVPFAVGLAVVVFFWYLIKYIVQGGQSADAKAASIQGMGYSILALFVMVSIWGIIGLLGSMLGVGQGGSVPIPAVPSPAN